MSSPVGFDQETLPSPFELAKNGGGAYPAAKQKIYTKDTIAAAVPPSPQIAESESRKITVPAVPYAEKTISQRILEAIFCLEEAEKDEVDSKDKKNKGEEDATKVTGRPSVEIAVPPPVDQNDFDNFARKLEKIQRHRHQFIRDDWDDNKSVEANIRAYHLAQRSLREEMVVQDKEDIESGMKRSDKLSEKLKIASKESLEAKHPVLLATRFDQGATCIVYLAGAIKAISAVAAGTASPVLLVPIGLVLGLTADQTFLGDGVKKKVAGWISGEDRKSKDTWTFRLQAGSSGLMIATSFGLGGYYAGSALVSGATAGAKALSTATRTVTKRKQEGKQARLDAVTYQRQFLRDILEKEGNGLSHNMDEVLKQDEIMRKMEEEKRKAIQQAQSNAAAPAA